MALQRKKLDKDALGKKALFTAEWFLFSPFIINFIGFCLKFFFYIYFFTLSVSRHHHSHFLSSPSLPINRNE